MRIPANKRAELIKLAIKNGLVLLPFDIETSHSLVKLFHIGECYVGHTQIVEPGQVISIQYMLPGMKKAKYLEWDNVANGKHDDSRMLEEFVTNIWSKADIVLGQNNDNFDYKTLNDRIMLLGLPAIDQKPSIDILKLSRKSFKSASHKLDFRSTRLGLGGKMRMMEQDWFDVEDNKVPVSKKMGPYGCKDVEDTFKVFWEELPYYKDLPTAVERKILEFIPKEKKKEDVNKSKLACPDCKKKRQSRFNTHVLKNQVEAHCRNCNNVWKLTSNSAG